MDCRLRQAVLAFPQDVDKPAPDDCWLSTGETKLLSGGIDEWYRFQDLTHDPIVVHRFGGLRTHEAIVVAAFCNQERVVVRIASVEYADTPAGGRNGDNVAIRKIF